MTKLEYIFGLFRNYFKSKFRGKSTYELIGCHFTTILIL